MADRYEAVDFIIGLHLNMDDMYMSVVKFDECMQKRPAGLAKTIARACIDEQITEHAVAEPLCFLRKMQCKWKAEEYYIQMHVGFLLLRSDLMYRRMTSIDIAFSIMYASLWSGLRFSFDSLDQHTHTFQRDSRIQIFCCVSYLTDMHLQSSLAAVGIC